MALDYGYPELAKKAESYEICFVPDNDYRGFLKRRVDGLEERVNGGNFVDKTGKQVTELKYDDFQYVNEGFYAVKLKNKWGYINSRGKEITPIKYNSYGIPKKVIGTVNASEFFINLASATTFVFLVKIMK